jgi:hypothetical protein
MLSSDILEKQFGQTKLTIVRQNDKHRIIKTVAVRNRQTLELSLVTFDAVGITLFPEIHNTILSGRSMGKAFRDANISFIRDTHSVTKVVLPTNLDSYFLGAGHATIVDVDIVVGNHNTHYCHIIEIYSPLVTWPVNDMPVSSSISSALDNFEALMALQP